MHLSKVRPCVADPDAGAAQDVYQVQVEDVEGGEVKRLPIKAAAGVGGFSITGKPPLPGKSYRFTIEVDDEKVKVKNFRVVKRKYRLLLRGA